MSGCVWDNVVKRKKNEKESTANSEKLVVWNFKQKNSQNKFMNSCFPLADSDKAVFNSWNCAAPFKELNASAIVL